MQRFIDSKKNKYGEVMIILVEGCKNKNAILFVIMLIVDMIFGFVAYQMWNTGLPELLKIISTTNDVTKAVTIISFDVLLTSLVAPTIITILAIIFSVVTKKKKF